jgi:hypothetical protein
MLSWLVRQACDEHPVWCRRRRDSRAREVYEAVTVSGARLVIRGAVDDGIGLDQEAWFLDRARQAGLPAPEVLIDFGDACGGRPLDDMAVLCRNWPDVDRAALAAGYGPAPFWDDHGRRLALGQLRLLTGFAAYDLRTGKTAEAVRDLADLKTLLASPAVR